MAAAMLRKIGILVLLALLLSGCARFVAPDRPMRQTAPAQEHLLRFSEANKNILPYKGIGRLQVVSGGRHGLCGEPGWRRRKRGFAWKPSV